VLFLVVVAGHEEITVLVILNFIGCGLHPKGAAFHSKKQAMVPKVALKSSLAIGERWQRRGFGSEGLSIGHLCKHPISLLSHEQIWLLQTENAVAISLVSSYATHCKLKSTVTVSRPNRSTRLAS
jgi:hypothetical protein